MKKIVLRQKLTETQKPTLHIHPKTKINAKRAKTKTKYKYKQNNKTNKNTKRNQTQKPKRNLVSIVSDSVKKYSLVNNAIWNSALCSSYLHFIVLSIFRCGASSTSPYSVCVIYLQMWCKVLHVLAQYVTMCNYAWMVCEGFYLHTILVWTFSNETVLLTVCYIIGWGKL